MQKNTELTVSKAKHFFAAALTDFNKVASAKRDLLNTENALNALTAIASHYPQVDAVEAAQLACIYIGQYWETNNLKSCEPATLLGAFMQLCSLGIILRAHEPLAYLVCTGSKCTIYIGVKGYQLLARRNYPNVTLRTEFVTEGELDNLIIEKGSVMRVTHVLNPRRAEADAVGMYAILSLDGGKTIYDIQLMDSAERDKYKKLHRGSVWANWANTMWATKLAKKIFKSLGLNDPDGSIATTAMQGEVLGFDISAMQYVSELDTLIEHTKAQLLGCDSEAAIRLLYRDIFVPACKELGGMPKDFSELFAARVAELKKQAV
jgi:recombinational DNA repair protein RecT